MIEAILAAATGVAFYVVWRTEKRRLRAGVLLGLTAWFVLALVVRLVFILPLANEWTDVSLILILLIPPLSVILLAGLLIANGLMMMRRESRALGNMLSLLAGVALIALPIGAILMVLTGQPVLIGLAALAFFASAYLGAVFVSFLMFTLAYAHTKPRPRPAGVVVLGAGLINGKMSRLLRSRVDTGIAVWQRAAQVGPAPFFVPSGGRGPDEPVAEAAAMADYAVEHGIPGNVLAPESESRTTEENLEFSRDLVLRRGGQGYLTVVTSNYHVPRAALLSREVGVDVDVIGAPTVRYFVPSAYLREFIAVLTYNSRLHLVMLAPAVLVAIGVTMVLVQQY